VIAFGLVCDAANLAAQDTTVAVAPQSGLGRELLAVAADTAPVIDGRLDEAVWQTAAPAAGFVQSEPHEGQPASERTVVRVLFDRQALYVGAWLFDSHPEAIVVGEQRRDAGLQDTDAFMFVLDTFRDGQNAFVFGTNPVGIEFDGQVTREAGTTIGGAQAQQRQAPGSGSGFNVNWDGTWNVATSADSSGWYAEFRIPFSTLRYGGGGRQTWGINFGRHIRRRNEQSFWAPIPRQFDIYRLNLAGALESLTVPSSRVLQVTPYGLVSARRDYQAATQASYTSEWGGDAKVGITPGMALDLTYNTDFAQVEVDEVQVNLTRFNLFFPEKRPFFLENAGVFSVGTPQKVEMFFSRRIGLAADGTLVPTVGGARLSGKLGGMDLGLLEIRTAEVEGHQPQNDYTVARVAKELPNRTRIGAMFVGRDARGVEGDYNRTYAADARVGIGQAVSLDAWAAATQTPGLSGREYAYSTGGNYTTRDWVIDLSYSEVGESFNPEVGYLERVGYRSVDTRVQRNLRFASVRWLRELRPHISIRTYRGFDGFEQSRNIHLDNHVEFANGAFFSPAVNLVREGLQAPFEISPGVIVPPGTYDNVIAAWQYNTNLAARLSLTGQLNWGGFYSGWRHGTEATIDARPSDALALSLRVSYDAVRLREGRFTAALVSTRVGYAFTPRVFAQSLVQYNKQNQSLSANIRFGWLNAAGTGLFVVYNDTNQWRPWSVLERSFTVKYTRQFNPLRMMGQ
jgi:hypothetical protein